MNWTQLTVINLAIVSLFNVALMVTAQESTTQGQFEQVQVQTSDPNVLFEETRIVGSEIIDGKRRGVSVFIANPDYHTDCPANSGFCDYGAGISRGILTKETEFKVKVVEGVEPLYGAREGVAIGNQVIIEIPFDAIDISTDKIAFQVLTPSFPGAYEVAPVASALEVRFYFDDGSMESDRYSYFPGSPLWLDNAEIDLFFMQYSSKPRPRILKIGFLPVRFNTVENIVPNNYQQNGKSLDSLIHALVDGSNEVALCWHCQLLFP